MLKEQEVYAVKHKNEEVVDNSRSGGVFTAISDLIIKNKGSVYGVVMNEKFEARHVCAMTIEERNSMRGSKYIQSQMDAVYSDLRTDLVQGKDVLFTGTPCQVKALKKYLGYDYANLLCMDIVCHGVPSNRVWQDFLTWVEGETHKKIKKAIFRNKRKFGWRAHVDTLVFDDGQELDNGVFTTLFYEHLILRPCCYRCPFKSLDRPGDITIGDLWGVENLNSELDDDRGVSLVLINTSKGLECFEKIKDSVKYKRVNINQVMQPALEYPFPEPENRVIFWNEYRKMTFDEIARKYGGYVVMNNNVSIFKRVCNKIKGIIYER